MKKQQQEDKYKKMTESPIGPLIFKMGIPCIISMLLTSFYNMADTFFVGMLKNNSATGAIGVVFSAMSLIQAIGFFFGHGSGNFVSRELGKQNYDEAANMVSTGFYASLLVGIILCVVGQIFLEPIAEILGSTPTILPYTKAYLRVILLGTPWMIASLVLNNQLRFQGNATYAMIGIMSGAILNIVLDPLLIFGCSLGVSGAAWATIISQFFSFCMLLLGTFRNGVLRPQFSRAQWKIAYYLQIAKGGLPSLGRQGLASVAVIFLNLNAREYGDAAVAAMSVVQRISMFGASAMMGFGQGFQPVCGFNYGAKRYDRVTEAFWFSVKTATVFLTLVSILGFAFAPQLIALFRDDPEVIACGTVALRLQCVVFTSHAWIVMTNMMLQTIGYTLSATLLAMARRGLFFLPAICILSHLWGLLGVQMTQAVCDVLTLICSVPVQLTVLRKLRRDMEQPARI